MASREFICVTCPMGCVITAEVEDGQIVSLAGGSCTRGEAFVRNEISDPRRMLTTTVRVQGGTLPLLPVHSSAPIPKPLLLAVAEALRNTIVAAPVVEGQVVVRDVLGTGVDMVASRPIDASPQGTLS